MGVVAPLVSVISMLVTIWLSFRNWNRRPSVRWFTVTATDDVKSSNPETERFNNDSKDFMHLPIEASLQFSLYDNGELQASGVKLFAWNCEIQTIQYVTTVDGVAKNEGTVFPFVKERSCLHISLRNDQINGGVMFGGAMKPAKAFVRVYWMDSPMRKPKCMKQDFEWEMRNTQGLSKRLTASGMPQEVSECEYAAGQPLINEDAVRGFIGNTSNTSRG